MKYLFTWLISVCIMASAISVQAQIQDLAELASGEFLDFRAVYDRDDNLYGYISTYSKNQMSKTRQRLECVLLDKNLNPFLQTEFDAEGSVEGYRAYFNRNNEFVLYPVASKPSKKKERNKFRYPSSKKIDLKTGEVTGYKHICFEDNVLQDCPKNKTQKEIEDEDVAEIKKNKYADRSRLTFLDNGQILVNSWRDHFYNNFSSSYVGKDRFMLFSKDQELLWEYAISDESKRKRYTSTNLLSADESFIYLMEYEMKGDQLIKRFLKGLNTQTGEEIFKKDITKIDKVLGKRANAPYAIRNFDKKVIATGLRNNLSGDQIGYYQFVIDKTTQEVEWRGFTFSELKDDLKKIDAFGKVEKGFYLKLRAIYTFESGATAILTEKYKYNTGSFGSRTPKTRDFVMIIFDEDFKKKQIEVIEKDKSTWSFSDLLFSQYLNDKKDYVFFYQDYRKDDRTKDKNWVLGINTIIDGTFKNEEIPMTSKDFTLIPYVAKQGYILLREFNKKAEHNQIRLERLNF